MYFPALQIGGRKRTAVVWLMPGNGSCDCLPLLRTIKTLTTCIWILQPFWMDKPSKHARIDVAVDVMTIIQDRERDVPLYDRAGIGALISEETESYIEGYSVVSMFKYMIYFMITMFRSSSKQLVNIPAYLMFDHWEAQ